MIRANHVAELFFGSGGRFEFWSMFLFHIGEQGSEWEPDSEVALSPERDLVVGRLVNPTGGCRSRATSKDLNGIALPITVKRCCGGESELAR